MVAKQKKTHRIYNMCSRPLLMAGPLLYGRKVLSFVRRSARLDARLQRAWDAYADTYLLNINAGERVPRRA